ncbi:hypothetical protein PoB_004730500 [Plakobranchus ocellatus]|uniref:Uncharacterized protein n=1 Tax=Plakobranchus ocellatus TaxID=259542 RepID=A0AAV4BJU7_9GAST|nr:hypothetical protein PoB_004730500 [Plakobranchus ocellatus]
MEVHLRDARTASLSRGCHMATETSGAKFRGYQRSEEGFEERGHQRREVDALGARDQGQDFEVPNADFTVWNKLPLTQVIIIDNPSILLSSLGTTQSSAPADESQLNQCVVGGTRD